MSAITAPRRQSPAPVRIRTARIARRSQPELANDHGFLIKVTAGVLLVTLTAATIAPLGWAALAGAVIILLATTAGVLHAILRLLNETDRRDGD